MFTNSNKEISNVNSYLMIKISGKKLKDLAPVTQTYF